MMYQLVKLSLLTATIIFLSGCFDNTTDTDRLCADNPDLKCQFLNMEDGQCRIDRTNLVWQRYDKLKSPTDVNKIKEIELVAKYRSCLELAAQIEPLDARERKTKRVETMIFMGEEYRRLVEELKTSDSAEVLYFLWSHTGDDASRRRFLQREGRPELETAEMQYALATFYSSRDEQKTEQLLHRSLELSKTAKPNTEIFKTLSSLYYKNQRLDQAYLWSMVAKSHGVAIASKQELNYLYSDLSNEQKQDLEAQANSILQEIELHTYQSRSIKFR